MVKSDIIPLLAGTDEDRALWKSLLFRGDALFREVREARDALEVSSLLERDMTISCVVADEELVPLIMEKIAERSFIPVIAVTGKRGDAALDLVSRGAHDVLRRHDLDERRLHDAVEKALLRSERLSEAVSCASALPEEKFRAIFQSITDGIALLDLEGRVVQVNRAFMLLQAARHEKELFGRDIADFIYVDDRILWKSAVVKAMGHEQGNVFEYRNIREDNRIIEVEMAVSPFVNREGNTTGFVAVFKDITAGKQAEAEIQKSEGRNRALVEAVPDLMFRLDDHGMYIDDYLRDRVRKVFPDSIMPEIVKAIGRAFATREIQVYEYPVFLKDEVRYYEARIIISGLSEVLVILRNVTDRKMVEEEMKKARMEAESANRAKSEFLANMSHEIRTPLHSILGFIEILNRTGLDSLQREYLNIVSTSARSLLGIINDILDFSKIESGKLAVDRTAFDPKLEFESVIDLFHARAGEKRIELLPFIDPLLPGTVMGDPLRIKQVLSNLLSNAVKFTPEQGIIVITIEKIDEDERVCRILFSVADTGIGIPDYKKKQIFEAFHQLDTSVARKYGGTGLGLSISLNLVRLMDSDIELESEPGEGSTFRFILELEKNGQREGDDTGVSGPLVTARAAVYNNEAADSLQEELVMRYLQSLRCPVTVVLDFEEKYESDIEILFFVYSSKRRDALRSVIGKKGPIPLVVLAHRDDLPGVREITGGEVKVLMLPLSGTRIYHVILEALHPELLEAGPSESETDEGDVTFEARVLVAEDNAVNRMLMKLMLGQYGIETVLAGNGLEAFDLFREKNFDLVLMDVNMPVSDGIEATEMIRAHERDRSLGHTPIIALTAKAMKGDREFLLSRGMDDYLPKPLEARDLRLMLSRYLGRTSLSGIPESEEKATVHTTEDAKPVPAYDFAVVARELGIPLQSLKTLLENFIRNAGECIRDLEESVNRLDLEAVRAGAHRLKGTSANLRFHGLADLGLEMESGAGAGRDMDYRALMGAIKKEYESIAAFLREKA